jgi:hypothetical protein
MKINKFNIPLLSMIICLTELISPALAQKNSKDNDSRTAVIKGLINSQNFTFVPQMIIPMRGGSNQLTSYYELSVKKDTLISYLPFIGRAYTAPMVSGENGFDFTATNFTYQVTPNKKKGWNIAIKPKDKEVQQFALRVFDNGTASLNVTSLNREPISFNGYITVPKEKK